MVQVLVDSGMCAESGGALVLAEPADASWLEAPATLDHREKAARLLLGEGDAFALDPWACARAAELFVDDRPLEADAAMDRAARFARDARITAERAPQDPRRLVKVELRFSVAGDIPPDRLQHAIDLSRQTYCSVWHSLRQDIELMTSFELSP